MVRLFVIALLSLVIYSGCCNDSGPAPSIQSQMIGDVELYTFSPDQQYFLGEAQRFTLPPDTLIEDALNSLGQHLSKNYFAKTYTNKATDIRFDVIKIHEIPTPSRSLRTAVINMVDTNRDAIGYFFQGSAGGQTTFYILAATFIQPHLTPPLLDGLVLLYNGEIMPELDHINLTDILTPRLVKHPVFRAINASKG
jgi:hypothetical protein